MLTMFGISVGVPTNMNIKGITQRPAARSQEAYK